MIHGTGQAPRIPTYADQGRGNAADVMSAPVRLDREGPDYGTGFAPFFVPLPLWVGAMVVSTVRPALSGRALAFSAASWRAALARRVVPLPLGWARVVVTTTVLHLALGPESRNRPLLTALLVSTSAAFTATAQCPNVRFNAAGQVVAAEVALALLVLQPTPAGGTYPIKTSPEFFQAFGPHLRWG
jgi:putative membrane protein